MTQEEVEAFIEEWSEDLERVSQYLKVLHTKPELLKKLEFEDLVKPEDIREQIKSWLKVYSAFQSPESEFYKPYWLPLNTEHFGNYIDLSNKNYPVFLSSITVVSLPVNWIRLEKFWSFKELSEMNENDINLKEINELLMFHFNNEAEKVSQKQRHHFFMELLPKDRVLESEVNSFGNKIVIEKNEKQNQIRCIHAPPITIGLLPFETKLNIVKFKFVHMPEFRDAYKKIPKIETVNDFVYFLRDNQFMRIEHYELELTETKSKVICNGKYMLEIVSPEGVVEVVELFERGLKGIKK